ncbi:hypothetical protein NL676_015420 [Syzygium grande]|nr:hypothetical protein NL676_015420 [Syzygium grande]
MIANAPLALAVAHDTQCILLPLASLYFSLSLFEMLEAADPKGTATPQQRSRLPSAFSRSPGRSEHACWRSVGLIPHAVIARIDIVVKTPIRLISRRFLSVKPGSRSPPMSQVVGRDLRSRPAIVGDITPADGVPKEEKSRREQAALDEMCQVLGGGMRAATLTHAEADNLERMDEWFNRLSNAKRKATRLHYYFHDMLLGKSPMVVRIAEAAMTKKSLTSTLFNSTVLQTELGESEQVLAPAAILVMVSPLCRAMADEVATWFDKLNC